MASQEYEAAPQIPASMKSISVHELESLLGRKSNCTLLDVSTPLEFSEVHILAAKNLPLDELTPGRIFGSGGHLTQDSLYLICRSGTRAAKAAKMLESSGITTAVVIEGGTEAWIESGYPVVKSGVRVISLERQVRIAAGSLVLAAVLLGTWLHPWFFGFAGFVGAGLVFAGITDFCGMGLLLAKLPYNQRKAQVAPPER
jgi:rhodanese-related sulfurtransferase